MAETAHWPVEETITLPPLDTYPDVHRGVLGSYVVGACGDHTEGLPPGFRGYVVSTRMKSSRFRLNNLDESQSTMYDQICERSLPDELRDIKVIEAGTKSWQTWLGELAGDEQLLEYLRWHVSFIEEQQNDPKIQAEIASQREQYKENLERGVTEGWLHPAAMKGSDKVDDVPVYIGDVFETALDDTLAYHRRNPGEIIIGCATSVPQPGNYESVVAVTGDVLQHELNHAVLGSMPHARWIKEALTEHIAQSLMHGDVETVAPKERLEMNTSGRPFYAEERRILRYLLEEGAKRIPVELATMAYSEYFAPGGATMKAFTAAIDEAWNHMTPDGRNAYYVFNTYVADMEHQFRGRGFRPQEAIRRAMRSVLRDIDYQPEVVFGGNIRLRGVFVA